MVKRIAVLTSGGDAPGMNAALRSVIRAGLYHGKEMYVIYDGYRGILEGNIVQVNKDFTSDIIHVQRLKKKLEILSDPCSFHT